MFNYDRSTYIKDLPKEVREKLIAAFNKGEAWKSFAECYCKTYEFFDLQKILNNDQKNPSECILKHIDKHKIDIELLCGILRDSELYEVLLILHKPEKLEIKYQPGDEIGCTNIEAELGNLSLKCEATGLPPPNYEWFHNNKSLKKETHKYINIDLTSESQEGSYFCRVYQLNDQGDCIDEIISKPVYIKIKNTPIRILKQPIEFLEVKQKDTLSLYCEARSYPLPQYQWYKNEEKLKNQTSSGLMIHHFSPSKEGKYYCKVSNGIEDIASQKSLITTYLPREVATIKVALLLANENYMYQSPLNSRTNVILINKVLKNLGFDTICLTDLTLNQMKKAIKTFCQYILEGAYGFFYYTGHGVQVHDKYLLPIDIPLYDYTQRDMLSLNFILAECLSKNPSLFVVVLDMCLLVPDFRTNPTLHNEIPILHEYKSSKNLVLAFSTSEFNKSLEPKPKGRKYFAYYPELLCTYLQQDIVINRVFELVGQAFESRCQGEQKQQIPTYSTSVTKPHRLVDQICYDPEAEKLHRNLLELLKFPDNVCLRSNNANIDFNIKMSPAIEPFLNSVQIEIRNLEAEFTPEIYQAERTNKPYISSEFPRSRQCQLMCPRETAGVLVIGLHKGNNEQAVGAVAFNLNTHMPILSEIYKTD